MTTKEDLSRVYGERGYLVICHRSDLAPLQVGEIVRNITITEYGGETEQPMRVTRETTEADFVEQSIRLGQQGYVDSDYGSFYRVEGD